MSVRPPDPSDTGLENELPLESVRPSDDEDDDETNAIAERLHALGYL